MKIFSAAQIKELDAHTIQHEPISSLDLMERAALVFTDWFTEIFPNSEQRVTIFCGPGNNGGDGYAVARLLHQRFYPVRIFQCKIGDSLSEDCAANLERLPKRGDIPLAPIQAEDPLPELAGEDLIIDAIFGSGLSRPVEGYWAKLIEHINNSGALIAAIDIPSGLFADKKSSGAIIKADVTLSFELPKLAFLFPQNHQYTGHWEFRSIGLNQDFISSHQTSYYYIDPKLIHSFLKQRSKFDHKGTYGHALLIMGSHGKVGAAILASRAALRSGIGLITIHAPKCAYDILQTSIPEAMVSVDLHDFVFSGIEKSEHYDVVGIGCGLGTHQISFEGMSRLFKAHKKPMVIDADALNIIAGHPALFSEIPTGSILTPHPKEFERLFGKTEDDFARFELQLNKANVLNCYIILKGANTCIASPDGTAWFNSTGNPGMATAGSGDVLTGILAGLLAQGYSSLESCLLGVFIHGLSGDLAAEEVVGQEALIASDIIDNLGEAFNYLHSFE